MKTGIGILFALLIANTANALEIKFHPGKQIYLNEANPRYSTYDIVAHLVIIKNDSNEKITLKKLDFALHGERRLIQELHMSAEDLLKGTQELVEMKEQGMQIMADIILPPGVLGKSGKLATTAELKPGEILTSRNIYVTAQANPAVLRANAIARNSKGEPIEALAEIKIVRYKSQNRYSYPLKGVWYMQAVPNVTSHHRWMSQTEFAVDFLSLDERGSPYKTDGKTATDFYGYGQPVFAAADGIIKTAINDAAQNWDAWLQREGEREEEFFKRSSRYQTESMKKDLYRAVTGNLVVIEHLGGEYSAYAHLKKGSVTVKPGDRVKQGQQIAEVGDTGDYYMAHLHFQISDHPDVLRARSLPFEFVNLKKSTELGHFARIRK